MLSAREVAVMALIEPCHATVILECMSFKV